MKIDPEADKVLERMGRDALLAEGARQHGVDRPDGRSIGAGYVQYWLRRQTEARQKIRPTMEAQQGGKVSRDLVLIGDEAGRGYAPSVSAHSFSQI
jgi:hypothetical protein